MGEEKTQKKEVVRMLCVICNCEEAFPETVFGQFDKCPKCATDNLIRLRDGLIAARNQPEQLKLMLDKYLSETNERFALYIIMARP